MMTSSMKTFWRVWAVSALLLPACAASAFDTIKFSKAIPGFGESGDKPGQLGDPIKVLVDLSDNIYVLDRGNDRVQKYDPATGFVRHLEVQGEDIALDDSGIR